MGPRKSGLPDLRAFKCRSRASPRSVSRGVYPRAARSADPGTARDTRLGMGDEVDMRAAAVTMSAAIALGSVAAPYAAGWPAKPVRIVSPFAPGGTSDTLARLLAGELGERLGQIFFVENRGGAGGLIGSAAVAAAEPDGGTFLISSIGPHVTSPAPSPNPR